MTIAAITSIPTPAVRELAPAAAVEPRRSTPEPRDVARRHDLVDALSQVLHIDAVREGAPAPAVLRFAHALRHDLRIIEGGGERDGQGRREWNDLPQRIDALATAVAANDSAAAPEVPPQPMPLTATTAAVHLMRVPSSHLLEAFSALRKALGEQSSASAGATPRSELAAFLDRLSKELVADSTCALPAGSVLNLSA